MRKYRFIILGLVVVGIIWYVWKNFKTPTTSENSTITGAAGGSSNPNPNPPSGVVVPPAPTTQAFIPQLLYAGKRLAAFSTATGDVRVASYSKKKGVTIVDA